MDKFTHTSDSGKARMVDVGGKDDQLRIARAEGHISLAHETLQLVKENEIKKGDVLTLAEIAGIQAAKQTAGLIPLCHNIFIEQVIVNAVPDSRGVKITAESRTTSKTGIEMEALTAVSVALLTVYDMCKAVDKNMIIDQIKLTGKEKHDITR